MSRRLAKTSALKLARSLSRVAGFSEQQYNVKARRRGGFCELYLRRNAGEHATQRAPEMRIGRGRSWQDALDKVTRAFHADGAVSGRAGA